MLAKVGISGDQQLIDRVFWVFDEDDTGTIAFRELGIGLEMLNSSSFEEKLEIFFDLCDEDNSNTIDKKEFYNLMRITLATSYEDRGKLKDLVNQVFSYFPQQSTGLPALVRRTGSTQDLNS